MPPTWRRVLAWSFAVPGMCLCGAAVGGTTARYLTRSTMGFDQIASALGGVGLGALVGLMTLMVFGRWRETRTLVTLGVSAWFVALVLLMIGYAQARARRAEREASQGGTVTGGQEPRANLSSSIAAAARFRVSTSTSIPSSLSTTRSPSRRESSVRSRPPLVLEDSIPLCPSKRIVRS